MRYASVALGTAALVVTGTVTLTDSKVELRDNTVRIANPEVALRPAPAPPPRPPATEPGGPAGPGAGAPPGPGAGMPPAPQAPTSGPGRTGMSDADAQSLRQALAELDALRRQLREQPSARELTALDARLAAIEDTLRRPPAAPPEPERLSPQLQAIAQALLQLRQPPVAPPPAPAPASDATAAAVTALRESLERRLDAIARGLAALRPVTSPSTP